MTIKQKIFCIFGFHKNTSSLAYAGDGWILRRCNDCKKEFRSN